MKTAANESEGKSKPYERDPAFGQPTGSFENDTAHEHDEIRPDRVIATVLADIDETNEELAATRKSQYEASVRLDELRAEIGGFSTDQRSSNGDVRNEYVSILEDRRTALLRQKDEWIRQHGEEDFPAAVAVWNGDSGREARSRIYETNYPRKSITGIDEVSGDYRRKWFDGCKEGIVSDFERAMRSDGRTRDALNLDRAIQIMKLRVPDVIEEKCQAFLRGETASPPFYTVWIDWNVTSVFEKMLGKPNIVGTLTLRFGDERRKIADSADLENSNRKTNENDAQNTVFPGAER